MSFYIVKGNLFEQKVDAIVIPSQPSLKLEGNVGGQARHYLGELALKEIEQCHPINFGECIIVNAYNPNYKKAILVANPHWSGGSNSEKEEEDLRESYLSSMIAAQDFGLNSVAFPILSIGEYKFPKRKAIEIAIKTITDFVEDEELNVALVVYDESVYKTYKDIFQKYKVIGGSFGNKEDKAKYRMGPDQLGWYTVEAERLLENGGEFNTFSESLVYYMATKGLSKFDCYNGVVSRTIFEKYLKGKAVPKKYTAVSLGINMGLRIHEMNNMLITIHEILDNRIETDWIIMVCINHKCDITMINEELSNNGFVPVLSDK